MTIDQLGEFTRSFVLAAQYQRISTNIRHKIAGRDYNLETIALAKNMLGAVSTTKDIPTSLDVVEQTEIKPSFYQVMRDMRIRRLEFIDEMYDSLAGNRTATLSELKLYANFL